MSNPNTKELSAVEIFYIREKIAKGVKAEALAKEIGVPLQAVEKQITLLEQEKFEQERLPPKPEEVAAPPAASPPPESPLLKAFTRRKEGGVMVMNATASELGDEIMKGKGKSLLESRPDCVTTVRK